VTKIELPKPVELPKTIEVPKPIELIKIEVPKLIELPKPVELIKVEVPKTIEAPKIEVPITKPVAVIQKFEEKYSSIVLQKAKMLHECLP